MRFEQENGTCHLTPAEAERGCTATVHYLAPVPCGICGGGGKKGLFRCKTCRGTGRGVWRIPLRIRIPAGTRGGDALDYLVQAPEAAHRVPAHYPILAAIEPDCPPQAEPFGDLSDVFAQFFGDGGANRAPVFAPTAHSGRSADIRRPLQLSAAEAARGCSKTIRYPVAPVCRFCGGSGEAVKDSSQQCPSCGGKGQIVTQQQTVLGFVRNSRPCKRCDGKGKLIETPCTACAGKGATESEESVTLQLPPGTVNGYSVTMPDKGLYRKDGSRGKLTVDVAVQG